MRSNSPLIATAFLAAALLIAWPAAAQDGIQCPSAAPVLTDPVSTFGLRVDLDWRSEGREVEIEIYYQDGGLVHAERVAGDRMDWHGPIGHYFARGRNADCPTHEGDWSSDVAFTLDSGDVSAPQNDGNQNDGNQDGAGDPGPEPPVIEEPPPTTPHSCAPGTGECGITESLAPNEAQ